MGTQLTANELIHEIGRGQLILPEFQRGYVWTTTQVREFLASLYRGYPTGSLSDLEDAQRWPCAWRCCRRRIGRVFQLHPRPASSD